MGNLRKVKKQEKEARFVKEKKKWLGTAPVVVVLFVLGKTQIRSFHKRQTGNHGFISLVTILYTKKGHT